MKETRSVIISENQLKSAIIEYVSKKSPSISRINIGKSSKNRDINDIKIKFLNGEVIENHCFTDLKVTWELSENENK